MLKEMEFSRLPNNVIEDIISRLPILDAVGTSLLSREWRHRWSSTRRLVFDKTGFAQRASEATHAYERRLVRAVDRALLLHPGTLHEFKLSIDLPACPDVDRWLRVLSRKDIRVIVLDIWKGDRYKLPSSLFECGMLNHLELFHCTLRPPASFEGFTNLITLDLQDMSLTCDDLVRLVSSCPLLQVLKLCNNPECDKVRIYAPNLQVLTLDGSFRYLHLKNTPVLSTVTICLTTSVPLNDLDEASISCDLIELFSALPRIRKLEIKDYFFAVLSAGNIPEQLPATLDHLKNINLDINLEDFKACMAILCLFRSCPHLEMLKIHHCPSQSAETHTITDFWEAEEGLNCKFNNLTSFEMPRVVGMGTETALMGFVLANAPKLRLLSVEFDKKVLEDAVKFRTVTKRLLSFPRASASARVILKE